MNKRIDTEYVKRILELANNKYEESSKKHREGSEILLDFEYPHLFVFGCIMDS